MYNVSAIEWHFLFVNMCASNYGICSDRIILDLCGGAMLRYAYNISYLTHGFTMPPPCNEPEPFPAWPSIG